MDLISTASSAAIDENVDTPSEIYHHGDGGLGCLLVDRRNSFQIGKKRAKWIESNRSPNENRVPM
jgi:hypothetical protein